MNYDKLLSVIVPSYNMEAYLAKNISSMMVQDEALRQQVEVIVVNDGSKDRTSEIAHSFATKYSGCITVIDKPNGHYGSCINAALPVAKGKYIRILDADDYADTEAFESFLQYLITITETYSETIDLIISDTCQVDPDGNRIKKTSYNLSSVAPFTLNSIVNIFNSFLSLHAITYRTEMLREMGYYQTEGCAYTDNEWFILPMSQVSMATYFNGVVMCYLVGRDGQTMQPEVYLKNFPTIINLVKGILEKGEVLKEDMSLSSTSFFNHLIKQALNFVYSFYLIGRGNVLPLDALIELDLYIQNLSPDLYKQLNELKTSSRKFRFAYIKRWRKSYNRNDLLLVLYRIYLRLISILRKS